MFKKHLDLFKQIKNYAQAYHTTKSLSWDLPRCAELDLKYLCDPNNVNIIEENIANRKNVGNIRLVHELKQKLDQHQNKNENVRDVEDKLYKEMLKIPNKTHPSVSKYGENPKILKTVGEKREFDFEEKEFHEISKRLNLVRTDQLGNVSCNKSYYILGEMADLEQALVNYALEALLHNNFELISVPDILPRDVIESCGMNTRGERNQVYTLDPNLHGPDLCLSGTSEMAIAGYLANEIIPEKDLPLKLCAVSRCYRAETSSVAEERGIYRVHEFTKVEMFAVCTSNDSENVLEDIRTLEEEYFRSLGLHFHVLDMPPHELGAQAYRKYDIEAWLPGRKLFGEVSSCSNCTDYQSRRLNIKYRKENGETDFVHTLNGTACAIPRLLIALTETGQNSNGTISIPEVLQKYMRDKKSLGRQKKVPELKLVKNKK